MASTVFTDYVTVIFSSWLNDVNYMTYNTTGSGVTVLANSPSLITPNIGGATGSSLTLNGLNANNYSLDLSFYNNTGVGTAGITLGTSRGLLASPAPSQSNDLLGSIDFFGGSGTGLGYGAAIDVVSTGLWSGTSFPTQFKFSTVLAGSTSLVNMLSLSNSAMIFNPTSTAGWSLQTLVGGSTSSLYSTIFTPSSSNYTLSTNSTTTNINGVSSVSLNVGGTSILNIASNGIGGNLNTLPLNGSLNQTGSLRVLALANATAPTGVASATGGTVSASTTNYAYISALDSIGNTLGVQSAAVTTTGTTSSIVWSWTAVVGASSYRIWCTTSNGVYSNYFTSTTNSFTQTLPSTSGTASTFPTNANTGQISVAYNLTASALTSNNIIISRYKGTSASGRAVNTTVALASVTIAAGTSTTFLATPATAITITLAAPAQDGEYRRIVFGAATTVTWAVTAPATATIGLPTVFSANSSIVIVYNAVAGTPTNSAATTWYQY